MSVRVMSAVFDRYPAKGAGEMLLALALADVARDDGVLMINDSVPELARKTRQTDRGVQLQLRRMVATGWLRQVRPCDGGRGRCSTYCIDQAWLAGGELVEAHAPETVNCATEKGELSSPIPKSETVNWTTEKGELSSPAYRPTRPNTVIPPNPPLKAKGGEVSVATSRARHKPSAEAEKPPRLLSLKGWLAGCSERGEAPVPEGDAVFAYCDRVGIGRDILALHWAEFKTRRGESGKRQADWRRAFRNSVRDNWFKLWFIPPGQLAQLTTTGRQALASQAGEHEATV